MFFPGPFFARYSTFLGAKRVLHCIYFAKQIYAQSISALKPWKNNKKTSESLSAVRSLSLYFRFDDKGWDAVFCLQTETLPRFSTNATCEKRPFAGQICLRKYQLEHQLRSGRIQILRQRLQCHRLTTSFSQNALSGLKH